MSNDRHLLINADRVLYDGLLGQPGERVLGAHAIYAAAQGLLHLTLDGVGTVSAAAVSVPPFVPHQIASDDLRVRCLMIEPEFVQLDALPAFVCMNRGSDFQRFDWARHLQELAAQMRQAKPGLAPSLRQFDERVFGLSLPVRNLDARITRVINQVRESPAAAHGAEECAALCHLSPSRFIHLFKGECGVPFRTFKTWKRARSLLHAVSSGENLTTVAQDLGYSDSAYFSNSIRHFYGLRPRDIMAGSKYIRMFKG